MGSLFSDHFMTTYSVPGCRIEWLSLDLCPQERCQCDMMISVILVPAAEDTQRKGMWLRGANHPGSLEGMRLELYCEWRVGHR